MNLELNYFDLLNQLLEAFINLLPRFIGAFLIFIIGVLIARLIRRIIRNLLKRVGIDKLADQLEEIDIIKKTNIRIVPSKVISQIIYYIIFLVVVLISTDVLQLEFLSELVMDIFNFIPNLITGMVVFLAGLFFSDAIRKVVLSTFESLQITGAKLIANFIFYFLFINIAIMALRQAGIETTLISQNISIILGGLVLAFGIGYGIASKDVFANFMVSYYYSDLFEIGQKVTIDDHTGIIDDITRNNLVINKDNGDIVYIPVHKLSKEDVIIHN